MSRRCYVATRFADADKAEAVAQQLRMEGHRITSRWHFRKEDAAADKDRAERQRIAAENYADILAANTLVALAHPDCRGTLCEITEAYGLGHDVVVVGVPFDLTLMCDRKGIIWARDIDEAVGLLRAPLRQLRSSAAA